MYDRAFTTGMVCAFLVSLCAPGRAQVNVWTYHNDNMRTGANLQETSLAPTNVNSSSFGKLLSYGVDGDIYAQPLYMSGLNISGNGPRNVVFVATEHNSVYALDADSNSGTSKGVLWKVNLGPSAATPTNDFGTRYGSGTAEIVPEIGITGTPVIDQSSGTLFVNALTHESGTYYQKLHALDIMTGAERPHSPVTIAATIPGTGVGSTNGLLRFDARQHLQRSALTLANGVVYVSFGSHSDTDPFHGWIIGYNAADLQPLPTYVFNSTPNSTVQDFGPNAGEAGIWMGGCGPAVDAGGNLYLATGNGSFNAAITNGGTEYGCTILKLATSTGLSVADYFAPYDQKSFNANDLDLGAVMLLPDQPGSRPHLLTGVSKSGFAWLLNRDQFTMDNNHYNPTGAVDLVVQRFALGGGVMATPAYFNGTIYYGPIKAPLSAFTLSNGMPNAPTAQSSRVFPYPGATPIVSANGNRNGIIWALTSGNSAVLAAYDATNISVELYNSTTAGQRDQLGTGIKFAVPTVANGKVYVGGRSVLSVFGLLSQSLTNSNTNSITGNANSTNAITGTYNGLFSEPDGAQLFSSGFFTLTVNKRGGYTGRLQVGPNRYPFKGQLYSASSATNAVKRAGASPLMLTFQPDTYDNNRLNGSVTARNWSAVLSAERSIFNSFTSPAQFAGRYTAIFPNSGDPDAPFGNGYATITVNRVGGVVTAAALADGTKLSQGTQLSQVGHWPFYASLYRGRGQIIGWLDLTNSSLPALSGAMSWSKSAFSGGANYPNGFDSFLFAVGSPYQAPSRGMPILTLSNGYLCFADGPDNGFTNIVTFSTVNKFENLSPNRVTARLTPATGLFRGMFVRPDGVRPIPFSGVVLQNQNIGSGYYLFGLQSGRVDLNGQ